MIGLRQRQSKDARDGNSKEQAVVIKFSVPYGTAFGFGQKDKSW